MAREINQRDLVDLRTTVELLGIAYRRAACKPNGQAQTCC
jgi:hypothetical protein